MYLQGCWSNAQQLGNQWPPPRKAPPGGWLNPQTLRAMSGNGAWDVDTRLLFSSSPDPEGSWGFVISLAVILRTEQK